MRNWTDDIDISFLVGKELTQIRISHNKLSMIFDQNVSIHCETSVVVIDQNGKKDILENYGIAAMEIISLVNENVVESTLNEDYSILINFSDGKSIRIIDDSEQYESFQIEYGEEILVF